MPLLARPRKPLPIKRISLNNWLEGTVTARDDGRTPITGLRSSGNLVIEQDGVLRPRPSLVRYGTQPTGTILGETFEFVKTLSTGKENWQINLQNVSGTTSAYISKDGGSWTVCTGKTYDNSANAHFCQLDDKVLIMNGTDNLSYFDITTAGGANTVVPFTALTTPSAPTLDTNTGLTGTTYTVYYRISANSSIGQTAASSELAVQVSTPRDAWNPASQSIEITWGAVTNAVSYNVYQGDVTGSGFLIASGVNGISFTDDGSAAKDVTRPFPIADSTAGPKVARGSVINGQAFLTGDKDHPRYIWFGSPIAGYTLDFSPVNGGGWIEVGRGTKEFPVRVMPFRDARGNSRITVLCQGTSGYGKRYTMTPATTTLGSTVITYFQVDEENGKDGTEAPDGVILEADSLWFPSRDGFKTTGTKPQLQNILSTNRVSNTIQPDIGNLNIAALAGAVGLPFEGRLYWALPVGSDTNNEIWVLDLNHKGAWMKPWNIAADWMTLYNDNSGKTHFLIYKDNVQYELTYSQTTSDDGTAFPVNATSGLIKFSEDGLDWAKVIDVTFVLLRPQGNINVSVQGKTEDTPISTVGADTFMTDTDVAGWGEAGWGGSPDSAYPTIYGWSNWTVVPTQFGSTREQITLEIDETLQWLTWSLDSNTTGVDFALSDVVLRYVPIGILDTT